LNGSPARFATIPAVSAKRPKVQLKLILKKLGITFPTGNGMHAFRHGRISYLAYSGVAFAVIREGVGHGSDAVIRRVRERKRIPSSRAKADLNASARIAQVVPPKVALVLGTRGISVEQGSGMRTSPCGTRTARARWLSSISCELSPYLMEIPNPLEIVFLF
jgi:hypothetical protein